MALTINDCHELLNLVAKQATGQASKTPIDTKEFVNLGTKVLDTGTDNVMKSLSIVMGELFVAVRPYDEKLKLFNELNTGLFTSRMRKVSFYTKDMQASGAFNTNKNPNNFGQGRDNTAGSAGDAVGTMWEQNLPDALQMNFASMNTWDTSMTFTEDQIKNAFRDEMESLKFWNGSRLQKQNEINLAQESFRRALLCDALGCRIGAAEASGQGMGTLAINLTDEFNKKFGTQYKSAELRTKYLKEFLPFMVSTIKRVQKNMRNLSSLYHNTAKKSDGSVILRQTPREKLKTMLYSPLFLDAEAMVLPEIFNDDYLDIKNYEPVDYWQSFNNDIVTDGQISVKCNYLNKDLGLTAVSLTDVYVVGFMFDTDALMTNFQFDKAMSTPPEARKNYINTWFHFARGAINDMTENGVVLYMKDKAE